MLQPAKITLRGEKGAPLTQEEMDDNLKIIRAVFDLSRIQNDGSFAKIQQLAVFDPATNIQITGTTIISTEVQIEGTPERIAYDADPMTISCEWFDIQEGIELLISVTIEPKDSTGVQFWGGAFSGASPTPIMIPASAFSNRPSGELTCDIRYNNKYVTSLNLGEII